MGFRPCNTVRHRDEEREIFTWSIMSAKKQQQSFSCRKFYLGLWERSKLSQHFKCKDWLVYITIIYIRCDVLLKLGIKWWLVGCTVAFNVKAACRAESVMCLVMGGGVALENPFLKKTQVQVYQYPVLFIVAKFFHIYVIDKGDIYGNCWNCFRDQ